MKNFSICSTESTTKVIQILLIILRLRKIFFNRGIFIPMKTKASLKFRRKRGVGHEKFSYSDSPFLAPSSGSIAVRLSPCSDYRIESLPNASMSTSFRF